MAAAQAPQSQAQPLANRRTHARAPQPIRTPAARVSTPDTQEDESDESAVESPTFYENGVPLPVPPPSSDAHGTN